MELSKRRGIFLMKKIVCLAMVLCMILGVACAAAYEPAAVIAEPLAEDFNGTWNGVYQVIDENMNDMSWCAGMMDFVLVVEDGKASFAYYEGGGKTPSYCREGEGVLEGEALMAELKEGETVFPYEIRLLEDGMLYLKYTGEDFNEDWYMKKAE